MPSDLQGFDRIEYESMAQLTEKLRGFFPQILGRALNQPSVTPIAKMRARPLVSVGEMITNVGLDSHILTAEAGKRGIPERDLHETLMFLEKNRVIERSGDTWSFTTEGKSALQKLIEGARRVVK